MDRRIYRIVLSLLTVALLALTFYVLPEFSVLGFVAIALFALEFVTEQFDKIFMGDTDPDELIKNDPRAVAYVRGKRYIAYAIVIAAALLGVPKAIGHEATHVTLAQQYIGTREVGENRGEFIDAINREARNPLGSPYCAAFVAHCLNSAGAISPTYRGGYSRSYIARGSVALPLNTERKLTGYLLVFARRGGGHIGIIAKQTSADIATVYEANTSPEGGAGSQWNGGGIWQRTRNLRRLSSPYNVFRATHVVPVVYAS